MDYNQQKTIKIEHLIINKSTNLIFKKHFKSDFII